MNKILRYSLLAMMAIVGLGNAWAGSVVFANLGLENGEQYTEPFDGGDFTVTFAGGANDGKYYTLGEGIRVYSNGTMTIAAKSGTLTKLTITYSSTYKPTTADVVSTGSYDPETGVWTGDAAKVFFTRPEGSGHWRVQSIATGDEVTPEPEPEPQPGEVQTVTVAAFNAAEVSTEVWYQLTGVVKNLKDGDQYGNFDLEDETGSVYVYGLLTEKGGAKKQFQALAEEKGITNGSKLTLIGTRGEYNGKIEVMNAYFVSVDNTGVEPEPEPEPEPIEVQEVTVAAFNAAEVSTEVWYQLTGVVKNLKDGDQYGNFDLEDETGSVYVYGLLTEKGGAKKQFQALAEEKGITNGSKLTLIGTRGEYNGKIEVMNAYFVSVDNTGVEPEPEPEPEPIEVQEVTVAAFNAAEVSNDVWYQLTGVVKNLKDGDLYGNFDLEDETGSVYVYGLLTEKGGAKKQFQALAEEKGITNGSKLTLIGTRGEYNGKIEVMNAYFVSVDNTGVEPEPEPEPINLEGDGTKAKPYTVADLKQMAEADYPAEAVWVKGVIVGSVKNSALEETPTQYSNIALAAAAGETEWEKMIPVQLPSNTDVRAALNVVDHPENIGKEISVFGKIDKYFSVTGVKNVTEFSGITTAISTVKADVRQGIIYNVAGQQVTRGYKGLVIIGGRKMVQK